MESFKIVEPPNAHLHQNVGRQSSFSSSTEFHRFSCEAQLGEAQLGEAQLGEAQPSEMGEAQPSAFTRAPRATPGSIYLYTGKLIK